MVSQKRRVLVVEDDLGAQLTIMRVLRSIDQEIEIDTVATADDAFSMIESGVPRPGAMYDMVLADIYTPGELDGLSLWFRCQMRYPMIPFIMVSGMTTEHYFDTFGSDQVVPAYLEKPFMPQECRQLICSLLHFDERPQEVSIKDIGRAD